jgi:hypothetical protein
MFELDEVELLGQLIGVECLWSDASDSSKIWRDALR